jgi:hypothetical protein
MEPILALKALVQIVESVDKVYKAGFVQDSISLVRGLFKNKQYEQLASALGLSESETVELFNAGGFVTQEGTFKILSKLRLLGEDECHVDELVLYIDDRIRTVIYLTNKNIILTFDDLDDRSEFFQWKESLQYLSASGRITVNAQEQWVNFGPTHTGWYYSTRLYGSAALLRKDIRTRIDAALAFDHDLRRIQQCWSLLRNDVRSRIMELVEEGMGTGQADRKDSRAEPHTALRRPRP